MERFWDVVIEIGIFLMLIIITLLLAGSAGYYYFQTGLTWRVVELSGLSLFCLLACVMGAWQMGRDQGEIR